MTGQGEPTIAAAAAPEKRRKRAFATEERYAVFVAHGKRCGDCREPLTLITTEVDHFFPEQLLDDPERFGEVVQAYQLPPWFDINGFENWRPLCRPCNGNKSGAVPRWAPGYQRIVDLMLARREDARRSCEALRRDAGGGRDKARLLSALEGRRLSVGDVLDLIKDITEDPSAVGLPEGTIVLDDGLLYLPDDVAVRHVCRCEREQCVGQEGKVLCTFLRSLSPWVIASGLFHACYDEDVECPRCGEIHRRGDIGRDGACRHPFADQSSRSD